MGLDVVAVEELKQVPDLAMEEQQSQELRFRCPTADPLIALRSVTDLWLVTRVFQGLGPRYRDLRAFGEAAARTDLTPSIDVLRGTGFRPKRSMTFSLSTTMRGERAYRRQDVTEALEAGLAASPLHRLQPARAEADLRLWLHLWDDKARLAVAFTKRPLGVRRREASLPVSLPGPHAYAMAALTRPRPGQVFADFTCGSGSIALERAENWRHTMLLAGDISAEAVAATAANFGPRHRPRAILRWDAGRLPLADASVDSAACNPPHGIRMQPEAGLASLYTGILREAARVLKPFALFTLLTPRRDLADRIIRDDGRLRIERCFVIDLLGQRPYLYVLRRAG
jgi:23S rRNA G2445 N2-methylase RlmL